MKYSQAKFKTAKEKLYLETNGRCQWCNRPVANNAWNFAHRKGRNVGNPDDAENGFFLVCPELHSYQTTKAGNLSNHDCVASYIMAGGGGKGYHFWDLLVEKLEVNKCAK